MHNIRYKSGSLPTEIMDWGPLPRFPFGHRDNGLDESQVGVDPTICRLEGNRVSTYATETLQYSIKAFFKSKYSL